MHHIPDDVFLIAARELAASVRDEDLEIGSLYPPLSFIKEVSLKIAVGITKYAYLKGKCRRPFKGHLDFKRDRTVSEGNRIEANWNRKSIVS